MGVGRYDGRCPIDCDENVEALVNAPEEVTDSGNNNLSTPDAQGERKLIWWHRRKRVGEGGDTILDTVAFFNGIIVREWTQGRYNVRACHWLLHRAISITCACHGNNRSSFTPSRWDIEERGVYGGRIHLRIEKRWEGALTDPRNTTVVGIHFGKQR